MTNLAVSEGKAVARPLHVLVPLIKKDLSDGDQAAEQAGMPYYRAAGEKMIEAKGQVAHGEFQSWVKRNFGKSVDQAKRYMRLARTTDDMENGRARSISSLRELDRESGRDTRPTGGAVRREYQPDIDKHINAASNIRNLHAEAKARAEERDIERKLAQKLIDIGFKALATELHPDKPGGSKDAMARLNRVRDKLKSVYA